MRARAKHPVFYRGKPYVAGDVFGIDPADSVELSEFCDLLQGDEPDMEPAKKRGRPRKETQEQAVEELV